MSELTNTQQTSETALSNMRRQLAEFWFYFSESKTAIAGLIFMIFAIIMALFADVIAPHSPIILFPDFREVPPVWYEGGTMQHILGTDSLGRDMLSRIIHGTRLSLIAGCIVVIISLGAGITLGLIAGFFRGWIETIIMRVMDTIMAVPGLLMALVFVAVMGPGLRNAMIAIAITYTPAFVRLTRASAIAEGSKDYVIASRVVGAGKLRLMFVSILPNCMAPLIVQATMSFSTAILDTAALGFLGMGAQAPTPEWGKMIAENLKEINSAPWTVTVPGVAILIAVLAINLMGDGLRDALDPKMKRS